MKLVYVIPLESPDQSNIFLKCHFLTLSCLATTVQILYMFIISKEFKNMKVGINQPIEVSFKINVADVTDQKIEEETHGRKRSIIDMSEI